MHMNCVNNIEVQKRFWSIVNLFLHGSLATTHFIKLQIDHHNGRLRMGAKEKNGRHVSRYRGNI